MNDKELEKELSDVLEKIRELNSVIRELQQYRNKLNIVYDAIERKLHIL